MFILLPCTLQPSSFKGVKSRSYTSPLAAKSLPRADVKFAKCKVLFLDGSHGWAHGYQQTTKVTFDPGI